jgi:hypothetical protein
MYLCAMFHNMYYIQVYLFLPLPLFLCLTPPICISLSLSSSLCLSLSLFPSLSPATYVECHCLSFSSFTVFNPLISRALCFAVRQGCQMAYFPTKNLNLCTFWRALNKTMSVYFRAIWNISRSFGIFYRHLVILCSFGIFLPV